MKISGEILNLSFGFRGVMKIRESIHSSVLQHAILESGMAVGIVNPHEMIDIDEIEPQLLKACEYLVLIGEKMRQNVCFFSQLERRILLNIVKKG